MKSTWSIVVHEVSHDYANIWVGTLFPNNSKPTSCRVRIMLKGTDSLIDEVIIKRGQWQRPFSQLNQRFYRLLTIKGLSPNTHYDIHFTRDEQAVGEHTIPQATLSSGTFKTLPNKLEVNKNPFVIALGSCYYDEYDSGQTAGAYGLLTHKGDAYSRPDIKFLTGDQVYLDIGLDSLSPVESEIRCRIADDYAIAWQSLRQMLRSGGTWFLADDHEYWNNYPHTSGKNPYLWMITLSDTVKKIWRSAAKQGVERVQQIKRLRTFSIGNDLSFCVADVRSSRTQKSFLPPAEFTQLLDWAKNLTSPGVLVLAQPLMVKPGGSEDKNLANFSEQYSQLLQALAQSGHDILCLAGDVHYGRIGSVPLGNNGGTLHEVISSPMSNLTGIDGRVAAHKATKLKRFPAINVDEIPEKPVNYPDKWQIATQKVKTWLGILRYEKTKEHFFTLGFDLTKKKTVRVTVQAWQLRERGRDGLPKKQFSAAHKIELK